MFLVATTLSFDILVVCIIKSLLKEKEKINNSKKYDISKVIEIKTENDLKYISFGKDILIKLNKNKDPIIFTEIYYEKEIIEKNLYKVDKFSYSNKFKYYIPLTTIWSNIYKSNYGTYTINPSNTVKLISSRKYCTEKKMRGSELFERMMLTSCMYKNIDSTKSYLVNDYVFNNIDIYLNIKKNKYDEKNIIYDIIGPNIEMIVDKKYEDEEIIIMGSIFFFGLAAFTTTIYTVMEQFKK